MSTFEKLQQEAQELRVTIINMIHKAGSGHSGGSLSSAEILTVLYEKVMNIRPNEPQWEDRDRFVLSKGHGAPALYAILAKKGYFEAEDLHTLRQIESCLQGHPCMFKLPGIEMSTGSLGMGISVGVGMALALKLQGKSCKTFVLCGDGELQEGQNWEAMMTISKWKLDNLVVIIDRNHVQLDGSVDEVLPMGDLRAKLESFGLHTLTCNGHNVQALTEAFDTALGINGPVAIIAETVKGKGVSFMEGQSAWHGKPISKEDYEQAIKELKGVLA
ncbi:transketolase [Anaerosolibacter carboniphilus]|uniref:Transketolase n=1 Tax=Anaerosolibacter carboniphilus TaxID=1417629 RepID=A0A841KUI2_9FIRM|nr:transketolase [Anaerosolibacter carboniphilus]MBB6217286.1 transketolase [Anaerosolibacter carboniphilus]